MSEHSKSCSESDGARERRLIFILCYQSVVEMKLEISPIHYDFDREPPIRLYAAPETFGSEIDAADSINHVVLVGFDVWWNGIH